MEEKIVRSENGSICIKVVGKIELNPKQPVQVKKQRHEFRPHKGGLRLGDLWPKGELIKKVRV
jgi:hypothetical protein